MNNSNFPLEPNTFTVLSIWSKDDRQISLHLRTEELNGKMVWVIENISTASLGSSGRSSPLDNLGSYGAMIHPSLIIKTPKT